MLRIKNPKDGTIRKLLRRFIVMRFSIFFLMIFCICSYWALDRYLDTTSPLARRFLSDSRCDLDDEECPPPSTLIVTVDPTKDSREYIVVFYVLGVLYMFVGLAIVCDEYFVPSLEVIAKRLDLSPDVSGATLMAAGGSAPELFTSAIGTFQKSAVGFGTITGSAVFNVLFVIAMCAVYAKEPLKLTWWPLARDCTYYCFGLGVLAAFFIGISPNRIPWYESTILFFMYFGYVTLMAWNEDLHRYVCKKFDIPYVPKTEEEQVTFNQPSTFRAGILSLLIKERSIMDTIPYRIVTQIHGNLEATFSKFDENGDGRISRDEMRHVFKMMKIFNEQEETKCDEIFTQLDTDKNNYVSFEEFKKWYISSEHRIETEMQLIFKKYDKTGDGHINHTEIRELLIEAGVSRADVSAQRQRIQRMSTFVRDERQTGCPSLVEGESLGDLQDFRQKNELSSDGPVEIAQNTRADLDAHQAWEEVTRSVTLENKSVTAVDSEAGGAQLQMTSMPTSNPNKGLTGHKLSEIWNHQESISYEVFQQWYQEQMFHQRQAETEAEAEHAISLAELLEWPDDSGWSGQFWFVLAWPLMIGFYFTIPDTRSYQRRTMAWAVLAFGNSIIWIGVFSTFMVDMVTWTGYTFGIPDVVMGVTFIAAGTSIPDLLSSVIVAKKGFGDMAVSSSIGSNIFDILVGLPFPWLAYAIIMWCPVYVEAPNLKVSILVLLGMVVAVIGMIMWSEWMMTPKLGLCMFVFYIVFLAIDLPMANWNCVTLR